MHSRIDDLNCTSPDTNNRCCVGVRFNKRFAEKTGKFVFGSAATVGGLAEWEDSEIVHLAQQAHQAANDAWTDNVDLVVAINLKKYLARGFTEDDVYRPVQPTVTTVLVIDNTAYISTSMRGGSFLYRPKSGRTTPKDQPRHTVVLKNRTKCGKEVVDALTRCQTKAEKDYGQLSGHRTGASCGEPMAMLAFCATTTGKDIKTSGARIVSIHSNDKGEAVVVPPCGAWNSNKKVCDAAIQGLFEVSQQ